VARKGKTGRNDLSAIESVREGIYAGLQIPLSARGGVTWVTGESSDIIGGHE